MVFSEKQMIKDFKSLSDLQIIIVSFLFEIHKYAEGFYEDNKSKFIPTEEDLNPNTKFINNRIFSILLKDEILKENL